MADKNFIFCRYKKSVSSLSINISYMKLLLVQIFLILAISGTASNHKKQVIDFIQSELKFYPEAQLVDLYKNYFQDAYGPGHIIPDTTQAGAYIDWELKQTDWKDTLLLQALGIHHDYYRVNLILVKNGTIPRDTLLQGLIESAQLARKPDINEWKKEWETVLSVIKQTKPNMHNWNSDKRKIENILNKGDVVMHHSKHYIDSYHPHYRIIHRTILQRWFEYYPVLKRHYY